MPTGDVRITRLAELDDRDQVVASMAAIFFETSSRQHFESESARAYFRERWLGRYLTRHPDEVFIALADGAEVIGYLVGCLDDPTGDPLFADISYFAGFARLLASFPAHLHINVTAAWRSRGIGGWLIEAFAAHAAAAGAPGMHVVTAAGARNNRFYLACGFRHLATTDWNGNRVTFFGRKLGPGGGSHLSSPDPLR